MKNRISDLLVGTSLMFGSLLAHADIPECVNANPASVDDVHRCISRIPNMSMVLGSAGEGF